MPSHFSTAALSQACQDHVPDIDILIVESEVPIITLRGGHAEPHTHMPVGFELACLMATSPHVLTKIQRLMESAALAVPKMASSKSSCLASIVPVAANNARSL